MTWFHAVEDHLVSCGIKGEQCKGTAPPFLCLNPGPPKYCRRPNKFHLIATYVLGQWGTKQGLVPIQHHGAPKRYNKSDFQEKL